MAEDVRKPPCLSREEVRNFYECALDEAERIALLAAGRVEGIDDEIEMLRVKLLSAAQAHPEDFALMARGVALIVRAVATRYRLSRDAQQDLSASIAAVIRGVGLQLMPEAFDHESA